MSKYLKVAVAALAAVAIAAPAMAEFKVSGYYRVQGIATNSDDTFTVFDGQNTIEPNSRTLIDQRLRMMVTNSLNEYVKVVWHGEVDGVWGSTAGVGDGGPGGDRISVETKNAYLDFKVPDSIFSARVGLQGIGGRYQGLLLQDDWSAAQVGMKFSDNLNLVLLYAKPSEGSYAITDDVNFYNVQLDTKAGNVNIGADLAWFENNYYPGVPGSTTAAVPTGDSPLFTDNDKPFNLYFAGIKADTKINDIGLDGFLLYAWGEEDNPTGVTTPEFDNSSFAATVGVKGKVNTVGLGARAIYLSGDSDTDDEIESFVPNLGGNYDFAGENLMIFLTDPFYNNGPGGRLATNAATNDGVGLVGLTAQANMTVGKHYGKLGLGYFMAADTPSGVDDQMGFETAVRVGTKIAEKVDISLNGGYAFLGDYWQDSKGLADSPDNIWKSVVMINVPF